VIKAIEAARAQGMKVITLTGKDGGKMAGSADVEIRVPHFGYADRIQEIHIKVIHILIMLIEKEMVKANRQAAVNWLSCRPGRCAPPAL
jgi:D-sedoheptulose 7-phosphate isomerase